MASDPTVSLIDVILDKTKSGSLKWENRGIGKSYKATIGSYDVHVDFERSSDPENEYELWVFNKKGDVVESVIKPYVNESVRQKLKSIFELAAGDENISQIEELTQLLRNL